MSTGLPDWFSRVQAEMLFLFLDLSDVPADYVGSALKGVRVNAAESGLEFASLAHTLASHTTKAHAELTDVTKDQHHAEDHYARHEAGGADEISVQGLLGLLAADQHVIDAEVIALIGSTQPAAHKTSHQDGGSDEISVAGLSGLLADDQHVLDSEVLAAVASNPTPGTVVQSANIQYTGSSTSTAIIPYDDTIPQNNEGNEFMSLAITPKKATNKLMIDIVINLSNSGDAGNALIAALFQDDVASALAAMASAFVVPTSPAFIAFRYYMTAGVTSSTTFKVRAGSNGTGTTTFNGQGGFQRLGGVMTSSITITEIAA